jgi:hypothetical protein
MTKRSWVQTPHYGDYFSGTIHLDQSLEQKIVENSNLAFVACAVILQMVGWTLRNGRLIKSSYIAQNEL